MAHRCGKWRVNLLRVQEAAESLHENLLSQDRDLCMGDLAKLSLDACHRPKPFRYQDPEEIEELIRIRKTLQGEEARALAKRIVDFRRARRQEWLVSVLEQASRGDYAAVRLFQKRQSLKGMQAQYSQSAGDPLQACMELKAFYEAKYTPTDEYPRGLHEAMLHAHVSENSPPLTSITREEIESTLSMCKAGKSCGVDGVPYELLQCIMQRSLAEEFIDFFNSVLDGSTEVLQEWLDNKVTFLSKAQAPSQPSHLRPIVLSATACKFFTKINLLRLRPQFPPTRFGQLCGIQDSQTLDGSLAAQQLIRLADAYQLPLVFVRLDIKAAFDSLHHTAIARFLCHTTACRESELLLHVITNSRVWLSMGGNSWVQPLKQGLVQGSAYSAEIFARVLDWFLGPLWDTWDRKYPNSWVTDGSRILHAILYADDLLLVATSLSEAQEKLCDLQAQLQAIGLFLSAPKCKVVHSAGVQGDPVCLNGLPLEVLTRMVFLGVTLGFGIKALETLSPRITKALNSFYGYYKILCSVRTPPRRRIHLLSAYITSRWRWMASAIRPIQAVHRHLNSVVTGMLMSVFAFPIDNLVSMP